MTGSDEREPPAEDGVENDSTIVFRDVSTADAPSSVATWPSDVQEDLPYEDKIFFRSHTVPERTTPATDSPDPVAPSREYDTFVLENFEKIRRKVLVLCREDPTQGEDIAQEALVIACERWARVAEMENPVGYVMMTAWRLALAWLKARHRLREAYPELWAATTDSETPTDVVIARIDLERAILKLSAPQQQLLGLALSGLSATEIGALLAIPPTTVRTRLFRARKALTAQLEGSREERT